ncbi:hypothetical protein FGF1_24390 [Flavobacteriaceae bacterium GF1]
MGRKSLNRKKETIVLFPQEQGLHQPEELQIGTTLRIGRPSNRYYQYIYTSLDFLNQKLSDLSSMLDLEGHMVEVIGMIHLKDGSGFAIVESKGDNLSPNNRKRLFVDRFKALKNHEIIIEH